MFASPGLDVEQIRQESKWVYFDLDEDGQKGWSVDEVKKQVLVDY